MPGRTGAELAEIAQLVEGDVLVAGEVEDGVEQHGAVPGREYAAIAVGPLRLRAIELEDAREKHRRPIGHARMARLRRLHRVHGQGADGVGHHGVAHDTWRRVLLEDGHARLSVSRTPLPSGVPESRPWAAACPRPVPRTADAAAGGVANMTARSGHVNRPIGRRAGSRPPPRRLAAIRLRRLTHLAARPYSCV